MSDPNRYPTMPRLRLDALAEPGDPTGGPEVGLQDDPASAGYEVVEVTARFLVRRGDMDTVRFLGEATVGTLKDLGAEYASVRLRNPQTAAAERLRGLLDTSVETQLRAAWVGAERRQLPGGKELLVRDEEEVSRTARALVRGAQLTNFGDLIAVGRNIAEVGPRTVQLIEWMFDRIGIGSDVWADNPSFDHIARYHSTPATVPAAVIGIRTRSQRRLTIRDVLALSPTALADHLPTTSRPKGEGVPGLISVPDLQGALNFAEHAAVWVHHFTMARAQIEHAQDA